MIYLLIKAEGAFRFRNRNYYEMENRASRLLAFPLKTAQWSQIVRNIKHPISGLLKTQPKDIAEALTPNYQLPYKNLDLKDKTERIKRFLEPLNMTQLSEENAKRFGKANDRKRSKTNYPSIKK